MGVPGPQFCTIVEKNILEIPFVYTVATIVILYEILLALSDFIHRCDSLKEK